jgi:predicted secreted acid phosphatase
MKSIAKIFLPLLAVGMLACTPPVSPDAAFSLNGGLANLGQATSAQTPALKAAIRRYYDSGRQPADIAAVEARAQTFIDAQVAAGVKKPAIVLDIDDTSVSSYPYEQKYDFGYEASTWNVWMEKGWFPAIPPTLALAKHARAAGVAVFFVTGRREPQRAQTASELTKLGYAWTDLILRPTNDHAKSVIPFKSGARAAIVAKGYDVLASIGDQWSDVCGGSADHIYKLPNPTYFLP